MQKKPQGRVADQLQGSMEYCNEHDFCFPRGGVPVCGLCQPDPIPLALGGAMQCCTKGDEGVFFKKANCPSSECCGSMNNYAKARGADSSGGSSGGDGNMATNTALAVGQSSAATVRKTFKKNRIRVQPLGAHRRMRRRKSLYTSLRGCPAS